MLLPSCISVSPLCLLSCKKFLSPNSFWDKTDGLTSSGSPPVIFPFLSPGGGNQECGSCLSTFLRSMARKQGERVLECILWMDLSLVTPGKEDVNDSVYLSRLTFTPVKSKASMALSSPAPPKVGKAERNV